MIRVELFDMYTFRPLLNLKNLFVSVTTIDDLFN